MSNQRKAYGALAITSIVWGTTWVASKIGINHMPAFELASIRQFLGGIIYVTFFLIKGELDLIHGISAEPFLPECEICIEIGMLFIFLM